MKRLAIAVLAVLLLCSAAMAKEPKEIRFGVIATDNTSFLKKQFTPLVDAMAKSTGYDVKLFFASDYTGVIEAMRFKKVDIGWFGNKSAIAAVDRANAEVFCKISNKDDSDGYHSLLITHVDSPLNSLEDLLKAPGKYTFGNGDPQSTSGNLIPSYYVFAQNGITPNKHFKVVRNANHETNALATVNKQVDVATNNNKALYRFNKRWPEKRKKIKVIWTSPVIPSDPFCWRSDLDPIAKRKIKKFFLDFGRKGPNAEAERNTLADTMGGWGLFMDSNNDQLLTVRQLVLFKDRLKLETSRNLSEKEKKQRIAEIDKKLTEISKRVAELKRN